MISEEDKMKSCGVKRASVIEKGPLRIVITDAPSNVNIEQHLRELISLKVKHVVRACEPTYETFPLENSGIQVHDLQFDDGGPPSDEVQQKWLDLVERCFINCGLEEKERISVHCIAGLGRAPVLVAIALIEFCDIDPVDAVQYIRSHRRGAINVTQFTWLEKYKRTRSQPSKCANCVVM